MKPVKKPVKPVKALKEPAKTVKTVKTVKALKKPVKAHKKPEKTVKALKEPFKALKKPVKTVKALKEPVKPVKALKSRKNNIRGGVNSPPSSPQRVRRRLSSLKSLPERLSTTNYDEYIEIKDDRISKDISSILRKYEIAKITIETQDFNESVIILLKNLKSLLNIDIDLDLEKGRLKDLKEKRDRKYFLQEINEKFMKPYFMKQHLQTGEEIIVAKQNFINLLRMTNNVINYRQDN